MTGKGGEVAKAVLANVGKDVAIAYGVFLLLLATAAIAVPYFWKNRLAPLAFAVPPLFTLYGFWPMWEKYRAARKMEEQMGAGGSGSMGGLGFGAYVIFATVLYLTHKGATRFLGRA